MKQCTFFLLFLVLLCTACEGPQYSGTKQPTLLQQGVQSGKAGHHEEALRNFELALSQHPDNADAHRNAGVALIALGRCKEAVEHLTEATRLNPEYAAAYINLAEALARINKVSEGVEAFDRAKEIDPALAEKSRNFEKALLQRLETYVPTTNIEWPYTMFCIGLRPPIGDMWSIYNYSTPGEVTLQRLTKQGGKHTIFAYARAVIFEPDVPLSQLLDKKIKKSLQQFEASRYDSFQYVEEEIEREGAPCRSYRFSVNDRGVPYDPGKLYILEGTTTFCQHPTCDLIYELSYSQRYFEKCPPLQLEKELDPFFEQIEIRGENEPYIVEGVMKNVQFMMKIKNKKP